MKLLVLDNYDSFTYNLVHYLRDLGYGPHMDVFRNDQLSLDAVGTYDKILLSPGPGVPSEVKLMGDLIRTYGPSKSILGICLGHQAIAQTYGAQLYNMPEVLHGITRKVEVVDSEERLFRKLPNSYRICHYHSWSVKPNTLGPKLKLTAIDECGEIMAISHIHYDVKGVQFHPESIMTEYGHQLLKNWIENRA